MAWIDFVLWAAVVACLIALACLAVHFKILELEDRARSKGDDKP